jgi:decaprenyl-phosphate phosphoribosyltransferase
MSAPAGPTAQRRRSPARGLVALARPQQWTKNVLVFAAPGTAGVLLEGPAIADTLVAFAAMCLAASATYALNDVLDRDQDLQHPRKRHRPVASGAVSARSALALAAAALAGALAGPVVLGEPALAGVVAAYLAVTAAYSLWLKHMPGFDLAGVASGFLLRAVAGAVAVDVPISSFFLIVASFGSLFLVAGKRHAEAVVLGEDSGVHRRTLEVYTRSFLGHVRAMSSAVCVLAYALWALEQGEGQAFPWFGTSIVPFVLAMLRYELAIEEGHGGEPDEIFRRNREIQVLGAIWVVLVGIGVYVD